MSELTSDDEIFITGGNVEFPLESWAVVPRPSMTVGLGFFVL